MSPTVCTGGSCGAYLTGRAAAQGRAGPHAWQESNPQTSGLEPESVPLPQTLDTWGLGREMPAPRSVDLWGVEPQSDESPRAGFSRRNTCQALARTSWWKD